MLNQNFIRYFFPFLLSSHTYPLVPGPALAMDRSPGVE